MFVGLPSDYCDSVFYEGPIASNTSNLLADIVGKRESTREARVWGRGRWRRRRIRELCSMANRLVTKSYCRLLHVSSVLLVFPSPSPRPSKPDKTSFDGVLKFSRRLCPTDVHLNRVSNYEYPYLTRSFLRYGPGIPATVILNYLILMLYSS